MEEIKEAFNNWNVADKIIVTTEKDATRLHLQTEKLKAMNVRVAVLPIKVHILFDGGELFNDLVHSYVEKALEAHREYGMQ